MRTLAQRSASSYENSRTGFRDCRFDGKRTRLTSPTPKPEYQFQRDLQSGPVSQLNGSQGNQTQRQSSLVQSSPEDRSPVDQLTVTQSTESSATTRSMTNKRDWELMGNQSLMEVEDQDQDNPPVNAKDDVVQLD